VFEIHLLELVHTLTSIADTLERVIAKELEHGVEHAYCLYQYALQRLCSGLWIF
jgi:hypothetical protein